MFAPEAALMRSVAIAEFVGECKAIDELFRSLRALVPGINTSGIESRVGRFRVWPAS